VARWPPQALRGHPRTLGGGCAATPCPLGGRAATPGVWGWPEPRGGLRANPFVRASLTVAQVDSESVDGPIGGDSGCGGGLGWVGGDGELGWVSGDWVFSPYGVLVY